MEPDSPPQNSQGDSQSRNEPGGGASPNNEEGPGKNSLIDILEMVGGLVFVTLGVALGEVGFHFWALILYFLAVNCGIALVSHRGKSWLIFSLLTLVNVFFFGFLLLHLEFWSESEPRPVPHLSLLAMGPPKIWFTNNSLFSEGGTNPTNSPTLFVPLATNSNVGKIEFAIRNDQKGMEVSSVEVVLVANKSFAITQEPNKMMWQEAGDSDDENNKGVQYMAMVFPRPVPSSDIFVLPALYFSNIDNQIDVPSPVRVLLKGTGLSQPDIHFWMIFHHFTNSMRLQLLMPLSNTMTSNGLMSDFDITD